MQQMAIRIAKASLLRRRLSVSSSRCCCCGTEYGKVTNRSRVSTRTVNYWFIHPDLLRANIAHRMLTTSRTINSNSEVQNRKIHSGDNLLVRWSSKIIPMPSLLQGNAEVIRTHTRHKSKGRKKGKDMEDTDEESSDEDSDGTDILYDDQEIRNIVGAPDNFSLVKVHVKGLRADALASVGLNMARNKIDEIFYKSKLLLNGERLLKKGAKVNVGDYVDVVTGTKDDQILVKRIQLVQILKERTKTDKQVIWLRVWKFEFPVDVQT